MDLFAGKTITRIYICFQCNWYVALFNDWLNFIFKFDSFLFLIDQPSCANGWGPETTASGDGTMKCSIPIPCTLGNKAVGQLAVDGLCKCYSGLSLVKTVASPCKRCFFLGHENTDLNYPFCL